MLARAGAFGLWSPSSVVPRDSLPSPGTMLAELTRAELGEVYDRELTERVRASPVLSTP